MANSLDKEPASSRPHVRELYGSFQPKLDYAGSIRSVVASLPQELFHGLDSILLRDTTTLTSREKRLRARSGDELQPLVQSRGTYYASHGSRQARIELFMDNILKEWPGWIRFVPFIRFELVHRILFHELGHHLLKKGLFPRRTDSEAAAWAAASKLARQSFSKRHPRARVPVWISYQAIRSLQRVRDALAAR